MLTCLPLYSHLTPVVVPVAHALRSAGHTVAMATAPAMPRTSPATASST